MDRVILNPKRERSVLRRHPWIFSGAVRAVEGAPEPGATVQVLAADGAPLGWGSYSPASQIRVRILSFDPAARPDEAFVARRVREAVARRARLVASGATDALRLVNAESDGLPGVVADVYAGWIVVQLSTAGAEHWKSALASALMAAVPGAKGVWNRSDVDGRAREGLEPETGLLAGAEPPARVEIVENGVRYHVDLRHGHKTGFYLDQRDARALVAAHAAGAEVLNCFCYTGGFGLAARAGGAAKVTQVDVSAGALALAQANEALNAPAAAEMEYAAADVFKQLRLYRDQGRSFDLIVLDPPKFADTKGQLMRATRGYKDINLLAMKLLRPNGLLATFSCSGAMAPELFDTICAEAAQDAHRAFQIVACTRQAADDHPVALAFPEGLYLKGLLLRALE